MTRKAISDLVGVDQVALLSHRLKLVQYARSGQRGSIMAQGGFRDAYMEHPIFHTLCLAWLMFCVVGLFQIFFPKTPRPMTETEKYEFQQMINRQRAADAQKCIDNVNKTYQYWPKEMQKLVGDVRRKCWED
jgi:hypothetical protein